MSKQLHKNFTDKQVKLLLKSYMDKEIKISYILQILGIKRRRFFKLLARYKKDPDNFSIQYNRKTINRKIDKAIEINIIKELNREKVLILDKEVPIRYYNYTYIKDILENDYNQSVIYSGAADKYKLTDKEIAIMVSSHNVEQKHVKLICSILDKINLDEGNLLRGAYPAFHKPTAESLTQNKIYTKSIYNPYSWKHGVASINLKASFNSKY